jgi:Zn-dependent M28 family amino/carboxypeptidase
MTQSPGTGPAKSALLSPDELALREELRSLVQVLGGQIGERNLACYAQLSATAEFIERSLVSVGLRPRRDSYEIEGREFHNVEFEIRGTGAEIFLLGAHYDSVFGSPGANDNGSGVAALLALARRFAGKATAKTLRFVAFANEEPPHFLTRHMGSFVYASRCKSRGDRISGMISLETIGYFSDAPNSQTYPAPGLGAVYPTTGNFIAFVSNVPSRILLRRVVELFRRYAKIPCQRAALPALIPGVGWSDQWSFWQHGYRGIMVTDTAPFRYPHYHRATDTPDKLDYDRFALVVSGIQAVVARLAGVTM